MFYLFFEDFELISPIYQQFLKIYPSLSPLGKKEELILRHRLRHIKRLMCSFRLEKHFLNLVTRIILNNLVVLDNIERDILMTKG